MTERPERIERKRNPKWPEVSNRGDFVPVTALAELDLRRVQVSVATGAGRT